jgi:hypothetical protein
LDVINTEVVSINGKRVPMGKDAFGQLARILGVPIQFQNRVDKYFGEEANRALVNKMKSALINQGMSSITLVASPINKSIIGFLKNEGQCISNGTFLEMASGIINDHGFLVRDFSVDGSTGGININCLNPNAEFGIKGLSDEIFNGGLSLSNSLDKGLIVSPYINRLICTNGMIGESFAESFKLNSLRSGDMEGFRKHLFELEKRDYKPMSFEERIHKAINTRASFAELEAAANLILGNSTAKIEEISTWIPLQETSAQFAAFGMPTIKMTGQQKKNAKTGTPMWDVINGLTHFSTHNSIFQVSDESRRYVQKEAGAFLAKTFDMENQVVSPFN